MTAVDPVTFEVLWHKLAQLAEEMGITYFRTTGSHIVITGTDASSAIMTPDGEAVAVGPYIVTQANVLPLIVRSVIEQCSEDPGINPGDVFICNDPYAGAIHQQDVATVAPIFHDGELIGWVGTSGHQADNGGIEPGGFAVGAKEVHQEGLRIPPVKLTDAGVVREDILRWIDNQVRDPVVVLDVRAQLATLNVGVTRMQALCETYGAPAVLGTMRGILDYSEARFSDRLAGLTDGRWSSVQYIDHDGHEPDIYRISCTVTKRGRRLEIDFTGSSANAAGVINSTYAGLHAGVLSAAYVTLAFDLPWNSGVRRCIDLIAAPGTVNNAAYPAPVTMATISAVIVTIDAVWTCLTELLLQSGIEVEAMANWSGTSLAPTFTGVTRGGEPFSHTEMSHFGGGGGARSYKDGVDTAGIVFNTTPNIPNIESIEQDFPVLYLFRRQLTDSGGPGTHRGGLSGELAIVTHKSTAPMETLFAGTGAYMPNAIGVRGGLPGCAVRALRVHGSDVRARLDARRAVPTRLGDIGGDIEFLDPKHPREEFADADVWYHNWQAGGGYGDPLERDPERVLADVLDLAVSRPTAEHAYGVVIGADDRVDAAATARCRERARRERLGGEPAGGAATGTPRPLGGALGTNDDGEVLCTRCGTVVGSLDERVELHAVRELLLPVDAAGPIRGQDYGDRGFRLRMQVCPGCAVALHADLAYDESRLVAPVSAPAEVIA